MVVASTAVPNRAGTRSRVFADICEFGLLVALIGSVANCVPAAHAEPELVQPQLADGQPGDGDAATPREFYGLLVEDRRVIFVLDHSKSMLSQLGGQTRLARLRLEMDRFFDEPDASSYFDIHCFNDRLVTYRRELVHNTERNVEHAREFLLQQPARGKTATYDALQSALIEGQDESAERIIFVTDGHPTTGSLVDPGRILTALRKENRESQIVIDVLAYDTAHYPVRRRFLQQLASDHGGQFIPLD